MEEVHEEHGMGHVHLICSAAPTVLNDCEDNDLLLEGREGGRESFLIFLTKPLTL